MFASAVHLDKRSRGANGIVDDDPRGVHPCDELLVLIQAPVHAGEGAGEERERERERERALLESRVLENEKEASTRFRVNMGCGLEYLKFQNQCYASHGVLIGPTGPPHATNWASNYIFLFFLKYILFKFFTKI